LGLRKGVPLSTPHLPLHFCKKSNSCNLVTRQLCWLKKQHNFSMHHLHKKELSLHWRETLLFLSTSVATVTSPANQQFKKTLTILHGITIPCLLMLKTSQTFSFVSTGVRPICVSWLTTVMKPSMLNLWKLFVLNTTSTFLR